MAVIKCKMCGGDLVLQPGSTVAECEYCGTVQTVPTADNEKKMTLFQRANRLRFGCEFDKAAGVYEAIVAEFPEEAEAYWGLVLCKYGIEYVDDPATGKKIPTCHRSSFDSVMDDANLDLALENADAIARRVYRDEAKAIEELRKGIVEVSSKEAPYDIFICYKETDEHGGRTLDSVLAQDVYDALVEKGYRVFFSRITLEDKLGQEYEPYIFAALHSAKIMLAFGTDYEYFNAVWVKNEWSRFLSLIASGEKKTLIPCYKGIDAYDMPKEFAKLQAQDLGKVGAIQDLLRGIEKILPQKAAPVVIQEKVVVGNAGSSNKIMSLLDRGNMALEDGDWAKADSFFEDVLNNESKNAQAYIGKTLATEKCRTLDAFARKRKAATESVQAETLSIPEKSEHIAEMARKFAVPGYLEEETIRNLYNFDRTYSSTVSGRRKQYEAEQTYWADHKWLSKAEKFAVGTVAQTIETEKQHLFAQLADRVKQAEAADTKEIAHLNTAYDTLIAEADAKAAQLNEAALLRQEADRKAAAERKEAQYQEACKAMAEAVTSVAYRNLMKEFSSFGDYKDGQKRERQCQEKMQALEAQEKQQADAREKARVEAEAKQKKRNWIFTGVATIVAIILFITIQYITQVIIPKQTYEKADALFCTGNYEEAITAFEDLGDYGDASKRIKEIKYAAGKTYLENGDIAKAAISFGGIVDYLDSLERSFALWDICAVRNSVVAENWHTIGLKNNGTVMTAGTSLGSVSDWINIIAVDAGREYNVGLKADGTVVASGRNYKGECNVSEWKNIVAISVGDYHTVGLKADGTVVAVGENRNGECNISDWKNIVAISAGDMHTIGLKSDGTVVAVGYNHYGQCNVSEWENIVAISAGGDHTIGLKSDGTVVSSGDNYDGQCDVSDWKDIVAISAGSHHTVGLKKDGTVVATKEPKYSNGQCAVSNWTNIVAISAGLDHTVGLKSDGTVVATKYTGEGIGLYPGQCDVSNWRNITIPTN